MAFDRSIEMITTTLENFAKRINDRWPDQKRTLELANSSGVAFYFIATILVSLTCVFVVIPANYSVDDGTVTSGSTGQTIATWMLTFFISYMMINYFLALFTSTHYDAGKLEVPTAEGGKNWGYCVPCQQYIPPRAHHCSVCRQCILKRESHCFFLGNCVGHRNQRFFVVYVFYTAVASLFSLLQIGTYLHHQIGPIVSLQVWQYLLPFAFLRWTAGSIASLDCLILVLFYITLMIGLGCCLLFFHLIKLILQGQTSFEMATKNYTYDSGAQMNLQEVFGRYWWLCFLLPIKLSQPIDGVTWSRVKEIKRY